MIAQEMGDVSRRAKSAHARDEMREDMSELSITWNMELCIRHHGEVSLASLGTSRGSQCCPILPFAQQSKT